MSTTPIALKAQDVADAISVALSTLYELVRDGTFPPADFRVGRSPRWTRETVEAWVCEQASTAADVEAVRARSEKARKAARIRWDRQKRDAAA
ncbi:MAG: helix-turn-helix domain-containing protein [Gammaproteobacteria bacterium]|nr:helix-turn-helix domain-containing protein [Gammaproteobacteria bacterium]